jgi:multidrug resistance protein MdtO
MGAQVFILPQLDSITGFTLLFLVAATLAAWIMTSSPRLSYLGVQIAVAFFLINLQEFTIQTSLAVARDRVVGILLGLLAMWLVFDRLWSVPAGVAMRRTFVANLRQLAQLARQPLSDELQTAIEESYSLRDAINDQFDQVRALADGVVFEFGPNRAQDLELRGYIRQWQPQLRTLFVMRTASLRYRLQLPGFELPQSVRLRQRDYDEHSAGMLEQMADAVAHNAPEPEDGVERSRELLTTVARAIEAEPSPQLPPSRAQSFMTLLQGIDSLTTSLTVEIAAQFGGSRAN